MEGDPKNWSAWIENAEAVRASVDDDVIYFAALEVDSRGIEPFWPLLDRLAEVDGFHWTFSYGDHASVINSSNRLRRICAGHNMVGTYALEQAGASHVLFLASDTQARDDVLPRLLELDVEAAACHITTYCLDGPQANETHLAKHLFPPEWDVRIHMESCACMLLSRKVINRLKWRSSGDDGTTDDPSMHKDLVEFMGEQVYSRHDVLATHWPESIPSIEDRHTDEARRVH